MNLLKRWYVAIMLLVALGTGTWAAVAYLSDERTPDTFVCDSTEIIAFRSPSSNECPTGDM